MRQENREIKEFNEIIEVMKNCDVCRLALNDDEYPYILPLNFGMEIVDGICIFTVLLKVIKQTLLKKITERHLKWIANISFSILRKKVTVQWHMKV